MMETTQNATPLISRWHVILPLVGLILLSLLLGIRREWGPPFIQPDSASYVRYEKNIFLGETDPLRTAGYPLFIKAVQCFTSPEQAMQCVVFVQIVLFELSVIFFYLAARELIRSGVLAFLCAAIYGIRYETAIWCFHIMTECLSLLFVVLFFYLMVVYIKRPNAWKAVSVGGLSFLMVIVRPAFVYVMALLGVFWIFRLLLCGDSRRSAVWGLAATMLAVALMQGYCLLNYRNYGIYAISGVAYLNKIEQIIITKLYLADPKDEISMKISDFLCDPDEAAVTGHPVLLRSLTDTYSFAGVRAYTNRTLAENRGVFAADVFRRLKEMASDWHFVVIYAVLFIELAVIVALWGFFRHLPWLHWGVWGMVYGMLFVVFWGSFGEYIRLMTPVLGLVLVVIFRYFDAIWQYFRLSPDAFTEYLREGL